MYKGFYLYLQHLLYTPTTFPSVGVKWTTSLVQFKQHGMRARIQQPPVIQQMRQQRSQVITPMRCRMTVVTCTYVGCESSRMSTVEPLYSGHPWGMAFWLLYGGCCCSIFYTGVKLNQDHIADNCC